MLSLLLPRRRFLETRVLMSCSRIRHCNLCRTEVNLHYFQEMDRVLRGGGVGKVQVEPARNRASG